MQKTKLSILNRPFSAHAQPLIKIFSFSEGDQYSMWPADINSTLASNLVARRVASFMDTMIHMKKSLRYVDASRAKKAGSTK